MLRIEHRQVREIGGVLSDEHHIVGAAIRVLGAVGVVDSQRGGRSQERHKPNGRSARNRRNGPAPAPSFARSTILGHDLAKRDCATGIMMTCLSIQFAIVGEL